MTTETKNEVKTNKQEPQNKLDLIQQNAHLEPVVIGRYMGFNNDRRMQQIPNSDKKEEKSTITYTISQKSGLHLQTEHILEYRPTYDLTFKPSLIEGRLYAWPIGAFDIEKGRKRAVLSRSVEPFLLD